MTLECKTKAMHHKQHRQQAAKCCICFNYL